jgi:hypothetical protein
MKYWIAVASADHVRFGRSAGFMQAGHGEAAPLRRIEPGDCVACYSPTASFGGRERLQCFTAIGVVKDRAPYRAEMGGGFQPYRREMRWLDSDEAPIRPLLERLAFTRNGANWGYRLRLGLFQITRDDMAMIAAAMGAEMPFSRHPDRSEPIYRLAKWRDRATPGCDPSTPRSREEARPLRSG